VFIKELNGGKLRMKIFFLNKFNLCSFQMQKVEEGKEKTISKILIRKLLYGSYF